MNLATKKWVFLKLSSIILVPLMFWFIINFISVYDGDYSEVVSFFSNKTNKFLFGIFLIFTYFFSALSISEVFEDYISNEKNQICRKQTSLYICYNNSIINNNNFT